MQLSLSIMQVNAVRFVKYNMSYNSAEYLKALAHEREAF